MKTYQKPLLEVVALTANNAIALTIVSGDIGLTETGDENEDTGV